MSIMIVNSYAFQRDLALLMSNRSDILLAQMQRVASGRGSDSAQPLFLIVLLLHVGTGICHSFVRLRSADFFL